MAKSSEEASSDFQPTGFRNAILLAIAVGGFFYATVMLVVPMVHPWTELASIPFGTAVAFERAFGSRAIGDFILLGAVISLVTVLVAHHGFVVHAFNGNIHKCIVECFFV